jgi:hypothetical protein
MSGREQEDGMATVSHADGKWIVELVGPDGRRQRYECATEKMALNLSRALGRMQTSKRRS